MASSSSSSRALLVVLAVLAAVACHAAAEEELGVLVFHVYPEGDTGCEKESEVYYETLASIGKSRGGNGTAGKCYAVGDKYESVWCGPDPNTKAHFWGVQQYQTADCPPEGQNVALMMEGTCYEDPATKRPAKFIRCDTAVPEDAKSGQYQAEIDSAAAASTASFALVAGLAWAVVAAFAG